MCHLLCVRCHVSCVTCHIHMSYAPCHMTHVTGRVSPVTCHMSLMSTAIATDPPPANPSNMHRRMLHKDPKKTTLFRAAILDYFAFICFLGGIFCILAKLLKILTNQAILISFEI